MTRSLNILMVAAENGAIPGAKVGGIGDVVRDVPPALAALPGVECRVSVVTPAYGFLHTRPGVALRHCVEFAFAGSREHADLYEVLSSTPRVSYFVLHHPFFHQPDSAGAPRIYCDDPKERPFATDASKYALFCAAVAEALRYDTFGRLTHLHLHDWHAAFLLLLRRLDSGADHLRRLPVAYTIHNLALQGIRPLRGDWSSLAAWYPELALDRPEIAEVIDPDYPDCVNPMAVGIRLAENVHVVSPTYKEEVLRPSLPSRKAKERTFHGGEGLERDLQKADAEGRLFGILNGCPYDDAAMPPRDAAAFRELLEQMRTVLAAQKPKPVNELALERIESRLAGPASRPALILTAVTRLVDQKASLMRAGAGDRPALESLLQALPDALFILQATGDADLTEFMTDLAERHPNLLFVNVFDLKIADRIYANGDLFLMPSSFEPCGISQMIAMRAGQPCVVHRVGGLKDTVQDGENGFAFAGETTAEQAANFVETTLRAATLFRDEPGRFRAIREAAFRSRFLWRDSVSQYVETLYPEEKR